MLKCLSLNKKNLTSPACKKEVHAFEKEMAADISLDVPLQAACRADLDKFCPKISRDHTRTLACLRNNRDSLTKACKAEELRFSEMEVFLFSLGARRKPPPYRSGLIIYSLL